MPWTRYKDGPPPQDGQYLCVVDGFCNIRYLVLCRYAESLHNVHEWDFDENTGSGFYDYDSEYGYYKLNNITHWMTAPKLPEQE